MKQQLPIFLLFFFVSFINLSPAHAGLFNSSLELREPVTQYVASGYLEYPDTLETFYKEREYKGFWIGKNGQSSKAQTLVKTLEESWTHGLNPAHYHLARLTALGTENKLPEELRAEFEILLSDAYIRYMRDLSGRRVDLEDTIFSPASWRTPADPQNIINMLNGDKSLNKLLDIYVPKSQTYEHLRETLIDLYKSPQENKDKIEKIIVNMERMRWLDPKRPERFVVVNIPSTRLWAIENGKVVHDLPVIVGRPKRPTNIFTTQITGVRLNPSWTVPPTIKKEDIWPKLKEDPTYLSTKGMSLISYAQDNKKVDPAEIDWNAISKNDLNKFGMVQIPGQHNPLGQVRVLMPNKYDIFIHGTNRVSDFSQDSALLSSGCIRMKNPEILADFIMKNDTDWREGRAKDIIDSGKSRDVITEHPIPIYLLYHTVWVDQQGVLVYGDDIYKQDPKILKSLERIDGFVVL